VIEERATNELALRQADQQPTRRDTPPTRLDRPCPPLTGDLAVDQLQQPEPLGEITDHHQPAMSGQRRIIRPDLDPSETPGTVHP